MRRVGDDAAVWQGKRCGFHIQIPSYVPQDSGLIRGGEAGSLRPRAGSRHPVASGAAIAEVVGVCLFLLLVMWDYLLYSCKTLDSYFLFFQESRESKSVQFGQLGREL